ncbi:hypothetical protein Tco_0835375, partial [Tanacetum coccineum]
LSLPSTSHRTDVPEAEMPPQKRACLTTPAPRCEIGKSSAAGAARQPGPTPEVDTWDEIVKAMMEITPTTLEGVDQRVTELDTNVRDRSYHRHTALALDREVVATLIAQTQLTTALGRIETLEARDLEPQDGPAKAGSSFVYFTKMLPTRRTTRTTPATTTNPTTTVTNAQLQALINQGVAAALAERDASRSRDGDNSHGSGTGGEGKCPYSREWHLH